MTNDRGSSSLPGGRVLAALLGLLAAADVLAAVVLEILSAKAGPDLLARQLAARQALAARDLLMLAGLLLAAAVVCTRLRLGERAASLGLLLATTAWLALSATALVPLTLLKRAGPLDLRQTGEPPIAVLDDRLGHRLAVGRAGPYRTNPDGFRGPVLPPRRSADEWRIAAVGDSITFGWLQVDDETTYPRALERELRRRYPSRPVHVLNAGVPSYTSLQVARLVEDRLAAWDVDTLLVCIGWNDLAYGYEPGWSPLISIDHSVEPTRPLLRWPPKGKDAALALDARAPVELRRNLAAVVETARRHSVEVVLLNLPTVLSPAGTARERELARRFITVDLRVFEDAVDASCARGVRCFRRAFPFEETGKEAYFIDHCHFSPAGAGELARRLADDLVPPR